MVAVVAVVAAVAAARSAVASLAGEPVARKHIVASDSEPVRKVRRPDREMHIKHSTVSHVESIPDTREAG